ncbi:uncharacterized protein K489DRAFT_375630 [Dissoconium aciculare CBS 342.82]|uniref:Uncharacterized protein n=1 Tax=Dissoconium aciculare CBS 342.82 TaxID=1314786 RepID=A0A6J3MHX2_9PEZI|nr:uncharacterized protein K489DRAFT_375630 [Dissoconium aciculare CBS 342.82]KAF1827520.1 hypothetical protein K489DRAFT_375630 [Dissoconium aciculare CBS 342.82]
MTHRVPHATASFQHNDQFPFCGFAYITATFTSTISSALSTAAQELQRDVLDVLQSIQKIVNMSNDGSTREQILANANILFPIFLPDKLIVTYANPCRHIPPLQLALLRNNSDQFQAMVFYGQPETSRKAHFLFSAPAESPKDAMQQLLLLTARLVKEEALKNFYPSQELLYVAEPEGGYMKQTQRGPERDGGDHEEAIEPRFCCGDDSDDRAFWWSSTNACNPDFYQNLAEIEREIDALGSDYFSDQDDGGELKDSGCNRVERSASAAVW